MNKDILLCGVGGQGTVLASKLIAAAAMACGETVHSAETIGMAQRGGSVTSHVRIGKEASSPLIPEAAADVMLAFEPAEAVRNLHLVRKEGTVIVNKVVVEPITATLQGTNYDGVKELNYLKEKCRNLIVVDAEGICESLGSARYFNVAILGVAVGSGKTGLSPQAVCEEIEKRVPEKFVDRNKKAFNLGKQIGESYAAK